MSNAQWQDDQVIGDRVLLGDADHGQRDATDLIELRKLVEEMWEYADAWHGPGASSYYRSRIAARARSLGARIGLK